LSNKISDVYVSANGGAEHFNALYSEHLLRKVSGQVLNSRDGPKKMLGPFVQMPSGNRTLCQKFSLAHVKVQVSVFLEQRLALAARETAKFAVSYRPSPREKLEFCFFFSSVFFLAKKILFRRN
jgi:hypothetical protein